MTTNKPLRWETHGWNNYLQRQWKRPRSEHVESNVEMSDFLSSRYALRRSAQKRYEQYGCCGMPQEFRYERTVEISSFPAADCDPIITTCAKCRLMHGRCAFINDSVLDRWKFINGGRYEPRPISQFDF